MSKVFWKPGTMLYPLPVVLVSCGNEATGLNIVTVAWTGTVCTDPAMLYISLRPSRYSYALIQQTGAFVVNLTTEKLTYATDFCGVKSGRDCDKFSDCKLTSGSASTVDAPLIQESPLSLECEVTEIKSLGSHDMFLARVKAVCAEGGYLDASGAFALHQAGLITYSHGKYFSLGRQLGGFGFSVKKKN